MKKLNKIILFLICIFASFIQINAANYVKYIEDDADLFNEEEEQELLTDMNDLLLYGNILIKTIEYNNYGSAATYAREYYHEKFSTQSGTLFLIDMDTRYLYIFSDGNNYNYITDYVADTITDNVYKLASKEKYFECAEGVLNQIKNVFNGSKLKKPMKYITSILIGIIAGFFIAYLYVLNKSKSIKLKHKNIIKNINIKFDVTDVNAILINKRRVYNPQTSDSSDGGGGGFSGGGGGDSSGGGGGHSF